MTRPDPIYLDHAATTPLWPQARATMAPLLEGAFGNASSLHAAGRDARKAVEEAREAVASAAGVRPEEVVFTSGGTEADNLALKGIAWRARHEGRDGIVVSAIEHHAILDVAEWLARNGFRLSVIQVDADGVVDLDALAAAVDRTTAIVSVMQANNEVGVIQPVASAAEITRAAGARFHTDAVQAAPWIPLADADLLSLSAHKLGGLKGVGALLVRRGVGLEPLLHGGGQERGIRSGTYNVAGIAGFGAAVTATMQAQPALSERVRALRDRMEGALLERIDGVAVNGAGAERLPNNCNVCIDGVEANSLLMLLDGEGVAASSGSACQSGAPEPSHVLLAMGVAKERALGALRLTLGRDTSEDDVDRAVDVVARAVARLRR
ncbi:MAG TPA: cysteine desulfurase family protein [Actinomycetota bacterium]